MEGIQYATQQGYNPMTTAAYASQPYASQFGQPGQFAQPQFAQSGMYGSPLSGVLGSGIGGLFSGQNIGRQAGQGIDGVGGMFQNYGNPYGNPYGNVDPITAAHIQAQLAQQVAHQQQIGRIPAFGLDPISAAIVQQRTQFGQQQAFTPWVGFNPLNRIDPIAAAYVQQAQIAQLCQQLGPQGQFGHSQFGQGQFGLGLPNQSQLGQAWLGNAQNLWAPVHFGRTLPVQYNPGVTGWYGGQIPVC